MAEPFPLEPSLWAATAPAAVPTPPLRESVTADVCIVGGWLCRPLDGAPSRRARHQGRRAGGQRAGLRRLGPQRRAGHPRPEVRSRRARDHVRQGARSPPRRLRQPHGRRRVGADRQAQDGRAQHAHRLDPERRFERRRSARSRRRAAAMAEARRARGRARPAGDGAVRRPRPVSRLLDRPPRRRGAAARLRARSRQGSARGGRGGPRQHASDRPRAREAASGS